MAMICMLLFGIIFLPLHAAAAPWTASWKDNPFLNVKDYGAVGDGVTDDTEAVRHAMFFAGMTGGGTVYFPEGRYLLKQQDLDETYLLLMRASIRLLGAGTGSVLVVDDTVPNTVDVIRLRSGWGFSIIGLTLEPQTIDSTPPARHAVHIDIPQGAGNLMAKLLIENNTFRQFGGYGIYLTNSNQDGFFTSAIQHNVIEGGISLIKAGDSLNFMHNTIKSNTIGIDLDLVPGAATPVIAYNRIIAKGGGIRVAFGAQIKVLYNTFEQDGATNAAAAEDRTLINLKGQSTARVTQVDITGNVLDGGGTTGALTSLIRLQYTTNVRIHENVLKNTGSATEVSAGLGAISTDIAYSNKLDGTISSSVAVDATATKTRGVFFAPTLLNSWVNSGCGTPCWETAGFMKDGDNIVHLKGSIKNGTTTSGTVLFTLPAGYRPKLYQKFAVVSSTGTGEINVAPNGEVILIQGGNTQLLLDGIRFLAGN